MIVRRIAAVTVGAGALAFAGAGLAHADEPAGDAPAAAQEASGPVPVQVLQQLPPVFDLVGGLG